MTSAGLLMYRINNGEIEFFLVHPGGPFYKNKDAGAWTIPKGLLNGDEDPMTAAKREFEEETGLTAVGDLYSIGSIRMKSGKIVEAWMFKGEWDESSGINSNTFPLEWPPKSGKYIDVPEADRGKWFNLNDGLIAILPAQQPFLLRGKDVFDKREIPY
jgi:predicted NUDIX family NTP pyrophosphohydrolase